MEVFDYRCLTLFPYKVYYHYYKQITLQSNQVQLLQSIAASLPRIVIHAIAVPWISRVKGDCSLVPRLTRAREG